MTRRIGAENKRSDTNIVIKKKRVLIHLNTLFDFSSFEKPMSDNNYFTLCVFLCIFLDRESDIGWKKRENQVMEIIEGGKRVFKMKGKN